MRAPESDDLDGSPVAVAGGDGSPDLTVDVGVFVAHDPGGDADALSAFARQVARDAADELGSATAARWRFHVGAPERLSDGKSRRPSEFLDEAAHRMVEGPYDLVVVLTDVSLVSRSERLVPGLASPLGRVAVVSTRRLLTGRREEPRRSLDSESVRWNAATLLVHLIGHVLGAGHQQPDGGETVMEPFQFDSARRSVPAFESEVRAHLRRIARRMPEEESTARGPLRRLGFHVLSALRNPRQVFEAVAHSRALLLPLSLSKLSTAAVTPTLIVVFSAESWDVGFHLSNSTAALFAAVSIFVAATLIMYSQNLFFPRQAREIITEHTALVNVAVFFILLGGTVGLFLLVAAVMLSIELVVFPTNLMENWPSLEDPTVTLLDQVRTAAFISTIGVLSGALGGGLENRAVLRHLALFRDRP